jgi:hypothetical protein
MKKILLALAVSGMLLSACHSNSAGASSDTTKAGAAQASGPKFKFDNDTHDFGKIKQGDKVTYKFNFVNAGKAPIIISNVVASCGCTQPQWPKTPIKPGESGQIAVTFDSTGHTGLQNKMITITANTNPAQSTLFLVGEVLK